MFSHLVRIIFRNRPGILAGILLITAFMAWQATDVKLSYDFVRMLPGNDRGYLEYEKFKKMFGEDGNVLVIGVVNPEMFQLNEFNAWYDLGNDIKQIDGIQEVVSITRAVRVVKSDSLKQFEYLPVVTKKPASQAEVDTLKKQILGLKFYEGLMYNAESDAYLMAVTLDKKKLNDKSRTVVVNKIHQTAEQYRHQTGHEIHYSGMPYIRTLMMEKIKKELYLFIILSIAVAAFILFLFFRSLKIVL
ncbi:MAG TPA: MMPL family transporter, partial [Bacteroidales bacterium]|nr:MMPL family transporter [Bacteroidales bacterium]